jgi:hypothetical protein
LLQRVRRISEVVDQIGDGVSAQFHSSTRRIELAARLFHVFALGVASLAIPTLFLVEHANNLSGGECVADIAPGVLMVFCAALLASVTGCVGLVAVISSRQPRGLSEQAAKQRRISAACAHYLAPMVSQTRVPVCAACPSRRACDVRHRSSRGSRGVWLALCVSLLVEAIVTLADRNSIWRAVVS